MQSEPLVALLTAIVSVLGAIYAKRANTHARQGKAEATESRKQASAANEAVNHRAPGQPSLYQIALANRADVAELVEWKRGYDGGPFDTGRKVEEFVREIGEKVDGASGEIQKIGDRVERIEGLHGRLGCIKLDEEAKSEEGNS